MSDPWKRKRKCGNWQGGLHWVICGGESGPKARPMQLDWVRSLRDQCQAAGVALWVKQIEVDGRVTHDPADWPEDLRVQQFPRPALPGTE